MRMVLFVCLVALVCSSCASSKYGCPGASYSGERYKATKFKW